MIRLIPTLLLSVALVIPSLQAQTTGNFYTGVVPVADASNGERKRAMVRALEQVLVRLTGKSTISAYPEVAAFLNSASAQALELGYVDLENQSGQGLSATFTENGIDQFLRRQQLPIWPRKRAPLLVWVLKEATDQPMAFVTGDDDESMYDRLNGLFKVRGMPVHYPLFDFEDQVNLPVREAWDFNVDQLLIASARYGAANWLVIRCYQTSTGGWRVAWILGGDEQPYLSNLEAESLESALETVVDMAVDKVAEAYAYIPSLNAQHLVIDVAGIDSHASYRKLANLLSGLSMVKSYALERVSRRQVIFNLEVEGDQQLFVEALAFYDQLSLRDQPVAGDRLMLNWQSESAFP